MTFRMVLSIHMERTGNRQGRSKRMIYNTYNKEKSRVYGGEVVEVLYSRKQWNEIERQRTERQKRKFLYYMKQRLCGLLLVFLGIWIPMMIQGDSILALFMVPYGIMLMLVIAPIGCYLMFTKKKILKGYEKWELMQIII